MRKSRLVWLLCPMFLAGCLSIRRTTKAFDAPPLPSGNLQIGAASVEITPPAGYPLAGHSIAAGISRGYWTRLYARAFFIVDRNGHAVVLVSADLFGVPAGLRARTMELSTKPKRPLPTTSGRDSGQYLRRGGRQRKLSRFRYSADGKGGPAGPASRQRS